MNVKQRTTLTRVVVGTAIAPVVGTAIGAMAKKKKYTVEEHTSDSRELYLLISGPTLASLVRCDPDDSHQVRQFATQVNRVVREYRTKDQREEDLVRAQAALEEIQQDRSRVEEAERALAAAKADRARLEAAQVALAAANESARESAASS